MISIVIPALNEETTIGTIVEKCQKHGDEIIIIDGNSRDKTREIAAGLNAKVFLDNGRGKGSAIRQSLSLVTGDIIVFIDADGSHIPEDIPRLLQPIFEGRAELVIASRLIGGSSELHGGFDEFFRLAGGAFITTCINWRFKVRLSDSQNGFRAIKKEVARHIDLRENITTIEQEMVIKTLKKGYRVAEVPSHEHKRINGCPTIKLSKVWFRYVYTLVKYLP
jgi:glycosyltransferase involved in cell wall biosynthesis